MSSETELPTGDEQIDDNIAYSPDSNLPLDRETAFPGKKNNLMNIAIYSTITEGIGFQKWLRIVEMVNSDNKHFERSYPSSFFNWPIFFKNDFSYLNIEKGLESEN